MAALLATHEWLPTRTDAGAAAPLAIVVHGLAGWSRTWWRVASALAEQGWRVIGIDLPGHGESPAIAGTMTREEAAGDVAATVEALGATPADLVIGHSLGAAVVMELAHLRPDLLRRMVLEDPPGTDRSPDVAFQEQIQREVAAARERPDEEVARLLAENPAWLEEDARQNVDGLQRCDLVGIVASLEAAMGSRVSDLVAELKVPALYLLATEERSAIWGEQRAELIAGVPAGSRLVEMDAGHVIHRDRFDDYVATILGWLEARMA